MALCKFLHGDSSRLDQQPHHSGWIYVTTDEQMMYFDINLGTEESPDLKRIPLNAKDAQTILGISPSTLMNNVDTEIPTSKAIMTKLTEYALANHSHDDKYYTETEIDTKISDLTNSIDEKISNNKGIIDVVELPTENIDENAFYRLLTGSFYYNGDKQDNITCYVVETLPDEGIPATYDMNHINLYYAVDTGTVSGYVDAMVGSVMNAPVGWYPIEVLSQAFNTPWGGIALNVSETLEKYSNCLVLSYSVYCFADKWLSMSEKIGWSGEGFSSEVFNTLKNVASGDFSHAEGYGTTASGNYSHAEGKLTLAEGYSSHAEGTNTTASGDYSHAEGHGTTASGRYQHVQGVYNIEDTENKYAHVVGNGTGDNKPSNAYTLDWEGNAWFAGNVFVGGSSQDDGKKLATEEYSSDYTDQKIADLLNNSTEAVDSIFELRDAMENNADAIEALQSIAAGHALKDHTHNYAGSSSVGGSANSAVKLDSSAGSATQPVFFENGKPKATTYALNATVPADAKFTDTVYGDATESKSGLMSASDKAKLNDIEILVWAGTQAEYNTLSDADKEDTLCIITDSTESVNFETVANKVTAISASSTDQQYASARAIWNLVQNISGYIKSTDKSTVISNTSTDNTIPSSKAVYTHTNNTVNSIKNELLTTLENRVYGVEKTTNKVTEITQNAEHTTYPSSRAVLDAIETFGGTDIETTDVIDENSTADTIPNSAAVYNFVMNSTPSSVPTVYTGSSEPDASLGKVGDLYVVI